jgi:hypothetical protein
LTPLTSVITPHHHASGFDQVGKPDAERGGEVDEDFKGKAGRAGHSKLMQELRIKSK